MNKFGVLMRLNIRNRLAALRGGGLRGESGQGARPERSPRAFSSALRT